MGIHGAVASKKLGENVLEAVLADLETAPIDEKLKALLRFLKKLTLEPDAVVADDVRTLKELGLSRSAVEDAVFVAFCFNHITRISDALGWALPDKAANRADARILLGLGYLMPFRTKHTA